MDLFHNREALFEMLNHGLENRATFEEKQKVRGLIQAFVFPKFEEQKAKIQALRSEVQAVATSTDFPVNITNLFNVTVEKLNYDMAYEAAFKEVPKDTGKQFWEIATVKSGVQMRRIPEGGRIRVEEMSGEDVLAYVDYYGEALGWTDAMIRYRQLAKMLDIAEEFRDSYYINKADNFYLLMAAAAALNITAWQAGATQLARDIATFNQSSAQLGNVNKDKGYSVSGQTPFILYANPFDEARIEAAFNATNTALVQGGQAIPAITGRPVRRVYTYNQYIARLHPILVLPGHKMQKHEELAPTTYTGPKDILTLNQMVSAWTIYGAAIADTEQCMQVNMVRPKDARKWIAL